MHEAPRTGERSSGEGTLAATFTLTTVLLLGLAAFLIPFTMSVVPEVVVKGYIRHNQDAENLAFVLSFLVFLPASIWLVPRYAARFTGEVAADTLAALAAGLALTLGIAIGFLRISGDLPWGSSIHVATAVLGAWLVFAAVAMVLAPRPSGIAVLSPLGRRRTMIWSLAGLGAIFAVLTLVVWRHVEPAVLVVGLVILAGALYLAARTRLPALSRGWGRAIDAVVFILVVLAVPDMVIFPAGPGISDPNPFLTYVIQFHQNLFLGPASQVLDGQVLLVDTVSQYGIGSIYLISAFFEIAPIGHGTLGFLDGFLSALVIGCGYLIMRMSGVRRTLAVPAIAVTVIVMAWGLTYPVGGLLQHGAIRYGLPILVIAVSVAGSRWPRSARPMYWLGLFLVGLSSIWALEAFLYTLGTWAALIVVESAWRERGERLGWILRRVGATVLAMVAVHVVFALLTLLASGELPDWGLYLTYLKEFVTGDIGDLTYDYMPWARGIGVGAFYLAAVVAFALLLWKRTDYVRANRTPYIALAGSLGYGISLYTYLVNRSLDHVLPYLLMPFILCVVIALSLALREGSPLPRPAGLAALGATMAIALIAVSSVASAVPDRAKESLLGYAVPGGESVRGGFQRLWNPPPLAPGADEAERLLETEMPGEESSAVLTQSDLGVEALARTGRSNSLGFSDPKENSWVPEPNEPKIRRAIDDLEPGDLVLTDSGALRFLDEMKRDPAADVEATGNPYGLPPLEGEALLEINRRFAFQTVATGSAGLRVVRLVPRKEAAQP